MTKEYKVVWIFLGTILRNPTSSLPYLLEAEVCTLGTGQWRRLGRVPYVIDASNGLFLNGCVHWIVNDKHSPERLCSFNIDNETFELFPSPPSEEIVGDFLKPYFTGKAYRPSFLRLETFEPQRVLVF